MEIVYVLIVEIMQMDLILFQSEMVWFIYLKEKRYPAFLVKESTQSEIVLVVVVIIK